MAFIKEIILAALFTTMTLAQFPAVPSLPAAPNATVPGLNFHFNFRNKSFLKITFFKK
jgi:hypothetical protein